MYMYNCTFYHRYVTKKNVPHNDAPLQLSDNIASAYSDAAASLSLKCRAESKSNVTGSLFESINEESKSKTNFTGSLFESINKESNSKNSSSSPVVNFSALQQSNRDETPLDFNTINRVSKSTSSSSLSSKYEDLAGGSKRRKITVSSTNDKVKNNDANNDMVNNKDTSNDKVKNKDGNPSKSEKEGNILTYISQVKKTLPASDYPVFSAAIRKYSKVNFI